MSDIPLQEQELPENTPSNPCGTSFRANTYGSSSGSSSASNGHHSVPVNLPPMPHPKEDFVDRTQFQPSEYNGNLELPDEYLQIMTDNAGEQKISKNGFFYDKDQQDRIVVSTFTLPGRGKRLFVVATDISKELQFRDSYLFLHKNKSLVKFVTNDQDKAFLIDHKILPAPFKSRTIGVITFRSLFLIYGARLLRNGIRIKDDYWEDLGKTQGFKESDPVYAHKSHRSSQSLGKEGLSRTKKHEKLKSGDPSNVMVPPPPSLSSGSLNPESLSQSASKFKLYKPPAHIPVTFSRQQQLESRLLPDPTDEVKQNYLLSSGVTNVPIFSKVPVNFENFRYQHHGSQQPPVVVTSPGGSIPPSITSSLVGNESLITSNGDNIYPVSCLHGQGITGKIHLNKNLVLPNYKIKGESLTAGAKFDDMVGRSIPVTDKPEIYGKKSNVGLRFFQTQNVIKEISGLQQPQSCDDDGDNNNNGNNDIETLKRYGEELQLQGTIPAIKRIRTLEYQQNAVSLNHNIENARNSRRQSWKYYWLERSGGFNLYKKNLKKRVMAQELRGPRTEMETSKDKYCSYRVIPKFIGQGKEPVEKQEGVVDLDMNENSDEEVVDERVYPLPPNFHLSMDDKTRLTQQRIQLVNEYREKKLSNDPEQNIDLHSLRFHTMLKSQVVKVRKPNPNGISVD
ncbi:hypothetical protein DASC09_029120 [Saccharomycopsis crataegensis]|uniref:Uncharacterized protein n=1 Tax=Saccharomycopsis crataegensis TaxID=43959 RepID=A0AAV5QM10_9ASCO|nr:hypothetical protein DASC09_029120 [Saccharomycopsis crataegensis]